MSVSQRALPEELGAGLFTRERVVPVALGLVAVLLAVLILHDVVFPASPVGAAVNAAAVTRGTVRSAVTGTGTVQPVTQQNVNFGQSGTLTEIDVKVGDKVTRGQTLAKVDPTTLQQALDQASNNLASAQATLNSTVNGNAVQQAQHNLANAQQSLADTQAQVNLTNQQDQNQLAADTAQLNSDQNTTLPQAQQALTDFNNAHNPSCTAANPPQQCTQLQQAITQAQNAVTADQNKVNQDNNKIATDQLAGQKSIDQANNAVTSAQDALNSQTISRPNTIAQQQAAVNNAQIAVDTAQRNLGYATLTAPFDGTILAINAQVGDTVTGGSGTSSNSSSASSSSSSSSGGAGGSGGTGSAGGGSSGGSGGSSGGSGGSSSSSTGSGFIAMGDLTGFQVVAPFAEADAARVQPSQQATVTFDAITGLTLPAHVLMVQGTATVVSNVTNYNVTLVLDQIDQRLRSGMTANANVVVQQAQNVLTLPNSVITRIGSAAFVTLLGKDGKTETRQPVQTGAVGDTTTEIVAGLNLGDRVVRPQLRTGTGSGGAAGAGRGGLGGGAVRIGGG